MEELLQKVQTERLPETEYYSLLIKHRQDIFMAVGQSSNKKVAKELGMSPQKFSTIMQMLKAIEVLNAEA